MAGTFSAWGLALHSQAHLAPLASQVVWTGPTALARQHFEAVAALAATVVVSVAVAMQEGSGMVRRCRGFAPHPQPTAEVPQRCAPLQARRTLRQCASLVGGVRAAQAAAARRSRDGFEREASTSTPAKRRGRLPETSTSTPARRAPGRK